MERNMSKIVATLILMTCCCDSFAAGYVYSTVVEVRIDQDGNGIVVFGSSIGGTPPSCAISPYTNALAFDSSTAGGRAILAVALAAKASGNLVAGFGTGTCAIYGVSEDLSYEELH